VAEVTTYEEEWAFPHELLPASHHGLTKLELFTMVAMHSLLARGITTLDNVAEEAVKVARRQLKELEEQQS
jgi:hypothetical protein